MKKYLLTLVVAVATVASTPSALYAQRTVGLSAALQANQFDILLPLWLGNTFSIAPAVGFTLVKDGGTDIRLALVPRFYFFREKFAPYIGGRVGVMLAAPDGGESTTDILAGLSGGGEYFLDEHFSLGVEAQINAFIADDNSARFGSLGGTRIGTAAAVFATVYF